MLLLCLCSRVRGSGWLCSPVFWGFCCVLFKGQWLHGLHTRAQPHPPTTHGPDENLNTQHQTHKRSTCLGLEVELVLLQVRHVLGLLLALHRQQLLILGGGGERVCVCVYFVAVQSTIQPPIYNPTASSY